MSKIILPDVALNGTAPETRKGTTARHMEKDCGRREEVDRKDLA